MKTNLLQFPIVNTPNRFTAGHAAAVTPIDRIPEDARILAEMPELVAKGEVSESDLVKIIKLVGPRIDKAPLTPRTHEYLYEDFSRAAYTCIDTLRKKSAGRAYAKLALKHALAAGISCKAFFAQTELTDVLSA